MTSKILVVDDERNMLQLIRRYLDKHDYSIIASDNASDALMLARSARPDLILSDADMPGLDGPAFCRSVKGDPALHGIPFLIMSGRRVNESDILCGYEGGADDYLLKPFSLPVMLAKIHAAIRNSKGGRGAGQVLQGQALAIDREGRTASVKGRQLKLTRKEFDLLALLAGKAGRVLSVPFLLENVWGYDTANYNDPHTVEVHISQLRHKLGPEVAAKLVTVTGYGYKLEE
jgi:DNA-binding response OmpR family regulator